MDNYLNKLPTELINILYQHVFDIQYNDFVNFCVFLEKYSKFKFNEFGNHLEYIIKTDFYHLYDDIKKVINDDNSIIINKWVYIYYMLLDNKKIFNEIPKNKEYLPYGTDTVPNIISRSIFNKYNHKVYIKLKKLESSEYCSIDWEIICCIYSRLPNSNQFLFENLIYQDKMIEILTILISNKRILKFLKSSTEMEYIIDTFFESTYNLRDNSIKLFKFIYVNQLYINADNYNTYIIIYLISQQNLELFKWLILDVGKFLIKGSYFLSEYTYLKSSLNIDYSIYDKILEDSGLLTNEKL